jgi:sec-independent protein translocase protein TatA
VLNPTEMLLLLLGVVIMVGGKKLPELGSGLGKGISEFKKAIGSSGEEEQQKKIAEEGERKPGDAKPDVAAR